MKTKLSFSIFELAFLLWSGMVILSITLAILGIFYPLLIQLYLVSFVFLIWRAQKKETIKISKPSFVEKSLLTSLIIFTIFLTSFTVPTIFGGRDEGSLSNSALLINKDHGLKHQSALINTFGEIYGEGKALNFPGFSYQKNGPHNFVLKSQFLPGYSSYLANFAYTAKPNILRFANSIPLIIFLLAFYSVIKQLTSSTKFSLLGVALLSSLVPLVLFYKFTLSEIFFASLLWPSLYFLIKYLKQLNHKKDLPKDDQGILTYWLIFIPLLPTVFIRIESLGIIFVLILILILTSHQNLRKPSYQTPIFLMVLLSSLTLFLFSDFFIITLKGFFSSFINIETNHIVAKEASSIIPKNWRDFYLLKLFYTYNLLPIFFFFIITVTRLGKEKKWLILTPLFFLGITGIYLIDANISTDHPWMLRRFIFSIIPLAVLYTIIFFNRYPIRYSFLHYFVITALITTNVLLSLPFLIFKQNNNLLQQVGEISQSFKQNDLILISQKSSGSGWSLISEPLRTIYHKQAIYFFNPADYNRLDRSKYNKVYLLTSKDELPLYKDSFRLEKVQDYNIKNELITPTKEPLLFPEFATTETPAVLYEVR